MKQFEIVVGGIYEGRGRNPAWGRNARRQVDRIDADGTVHWLGLVGPGAGYGECKLASFARWAASRLLAMEARK